MAKKNIEVRLILSVADHISTKEAVREIKTRIDSVCGHYWDVEEKKIRVKKVTLAALQQGSGQ